MLVVAGLAQVLAPHELMASDFASRGLAKMVPYHFAGWTFVPSIVLVTTSDQPDAAREQPNNAKIYSQVLGRGYADSQGNVVMLMIAYGPAQDMRLKAHRPELCYQAAGFRISRAAEGLVYHGNGAGPLAVERLTAIREARVERITYWMRVGERVSHGVIDRQFIRLAYGLRGIIPDGALIRVSTIGSTPEAAFKLQDRFINDFLATIAPSQRHFFTGKT